MSENRDYDIVKGKLPRTDKNGQDVTGDYLGKGGRHRKDGTYSAVVYDLEIVDPESDEYQETVPVISQRHVENKSVQYGDLPWWGQLLVDIAEVTIPIVITGLTHTAMQGFEKWLSNRRKQNFVKKPVNKTSAIKAKALVIEPTPKSNPENCLGMPNERINKPSARFPVSIAMPGEFHDAYKRYSTNMTSEEAQKELLDAFVLYILSLKKLHKIANANIYNASGNIIDGHKLVELATNPEIVMQINYIVQNNPKLLDEWQSIALSDILGREIIHDMHYIPIDEQMLRHKLLGIPVCTSDSK